MTTGQEPALQEVLELIPYEPLELGVSRSIYTKDRANIRYDFIILEPPWDLERGHLPVDLGGRTLSWCGTDSVIELDARGATGANGTASFALSDYVCPEPDTKIRTPVTFLATPVSGDRAVFLTSAINTITNDVRLEVYSWDPGGNLAPGVPFSWRLRVRYTSG